MPDRCTDPSCTEHWPAKRQEFGIERLIPPWSTNPDLPAGQPYEDRRIERLSSREAAEDIIRGWHDGTWRIMVRTVTDWVPADE